MSTDLTSKDFIIRHDGVQVAVTDYTKTSSTVLTYGGSSLPSTVVEVRRVTPTPVVQVISGFPSKVSSTLWNQEFDRIVRRAEEYTLNGIGPGSVGTITVDSSVFSASWSGDTVAAPSRSAVYAEMITKATIASPTFTGNPTAPTPAANDNDTSIATTAYVQTELADYATTASPVFTGTPTAPTAVAATNTTQIATTAFVKSNIIDTAYSSAWNGETANAPSRNAVYDQVELKANLASPTFTGTVTIPTAAVTTMSGTPDFTGNATAITQTAGNNSTRLATTAFVATSFAPLASPTFTGTVTVPTAAVTTFSGTPNFTGNATAITQSLTDNSTRLATTAFAHPRGGNVDTDLDVRVLNTYNSDLGSASAVTVVSPGTTGHGTLRVYSGIHSASTFTITLRQNPNDGGDRAVIWHINIFFSAGNGTAVARGDMILVRYGGTKAQTSAGLHTEIVTSGHAAMGAPTLASVDADNSTAQYTSISGESFGIRIWSQRIA